MTVTGKDIGDIVEAYCSRCKLNLDTSVAALKNGSVVKVMCRTCGNEVKYRDPVDPQVQKQKALQRLMRKRNKKFEPLKETELKGPSSLRELWNELTDEIDARYARVYNSETQYAIKDALLHKRHGMGIVHSVNDDGTISVLFRKGFIQLPEA